MWYLGKAYLKIIGCVIEYLAPEILENKGHGKAVDWWSLGTLLFEMVCGLPPFYDTNVQRMYHKILHSPLKFPQKYVLVPKRNWNWIIILNMNLSGLISLVLFFVFV